MGVSDSKNETSAANGGAYQLSQGLPVTGGIDKNFSMRETRRVGDGPGGSRYRIALVVEIEGDELTQGLQGVVSSVYGGGGDLGVAEGKERVSKATIE